MSAPLTVIIPTLNAAQRLGPTLRSLWEGVEAGLIAELIIADGGSNDGIEQLAEEIGARLVRSNPGRGIQMATGTKAAKSPWVLLLHADTQLSTGWSQAALRHIQTSTNAAYGRLQFSQQGLAPRIVSGWANLRSKIFKLPYGDQTLLISQEHLNRIGGIPQIPLMEDVALARLLKRQLTALPYTATTDGSKFAARGWMRQGSRNLGTLMLYFFGRSPEQLAERYRR